MATMLTNSEVATVTALIGITLKVGACPPEARMDAINAWMKLRASAGMPLTDHEGLTPGEDY